MPLPTPQEAMEKWQRRMSASGQDVTNGVNAVTESPMEKAAAKVDDWIAGVQNARQKYVDGLRGTSLQEWKRRMIEVGVPRMQQGASAAGPKVLAAYQSLFPYIEQVRQEVDSMPSSTLEDNIARATHNIRRMAQYQG